MRTRERIAKKRELDKLFSIREIYNKVTFQNSYGLNPLFWRFINPNVGTNHNQFGNSDNCLDYINRHIQFTDEEEIQKD